MSIAHIVLIFLKIVITVQLVLIYFKIQSPTELTFLLTEAVFNIYVGLFIMIYFLFVRNKMVIDLNDRLVFLLGGFLLIYNIHYKNIVSAAFDFLKI